MDQADLSNTKDVNETVVRRMVARKTRWTVKAMDRLAQGLISAAGVGTIWRSPRYCAPPRVVAPLFESPVARRPADGRQWLTPEQAPVFVSLRSQALGWAVTGDGIRASSGRTAGRLGRPSCWLRRRKSRQCRFQPRMSWGFGIRGRHGQVGNSALNRAWPSRAIYPGHPEAAAEGRGT